MAAARPPQAPQRHRGEMTTTAGERVLIVEDEPATRVGLTELVRTWGFTAAVRERRPGGARAHHGVSPDHHHQRPGDAPHGRPRPAAGAGERRGRVHHRHPDRAGHGGNRRRSHQGRRLRLPDEADRAAAAEDPARQDRRAAGHAARGEGAAQAAARSGRLRPDGRQQRADAQGVSDDRAGGADRRRRCSSGASRAPARSSWRRPFTSSVRATSCRSSRSTARRFPRRCSRARSSGTRRARSPAPSIGARAASSSPIAARCSSTRSPR